MNCPRGQDCRTELPDVFRASMRNVPSAVAILTAHADGADFGMTATAVCSLAANPPKLLACVNRTSRFSAALAKTGHLAVNFTGAGQADIAVEFSRGSNSHETRFTFGEWTRSERGTLLLRDASAVFDCEIEHITPEATHNMIVLRVLCAGSTESMPLVYWSGAYARVSTAAQ